MELNSRIQKIIQYSMLSASEFADEIGVQRSNISHIISGRNKPSLDFIIKIKDRFPEIAWEWIIEGKGEMLPTTPPTLSQNVQGSKINIDDNENSQKSLMELFAPSELSLSFQPKSPQEEKMISPETNTRESPITSPTTHKEKIEDSQPLENKEILIENQETHKIKKIIFFYENGKFEVFEP